MAFTDRLHNRGSISGYDIDNSCKFEKDNTEYLTNTPTSNGDRQKFTTSLWVKRTELGLGVSGANQTLFGAQPSSGYSNSNTYQWGFTHDDKFGLGLQTFWVIQTNRVFKDTSAWYHIVVRTDTTQLSHNRIRLYVNGVQDTSFSTNALSSIAQNAELGVNHTTRHQIGSLIANSWHSKCYIAEINHVDGQQLAPTEFGEYDDDSGIWKPKKYTGTYGTNGFYLDFKNASDLGEDQSGNNNDWTKNNITSVDQATDTPTNNFCTWLSNGTIFNNGSDNMLFNEGGTRMTRGGGTGWTTHYANMAASSGKWYFEHESVGANNTMMGAIPVDGTTDNSSGRNNHYLGNVAGHGVGYQFIDRYVYQNGSYFLNGGSNPNSGTIVQVALDLDNGKIYFGLDNTWLNQQTSSNPSNGTNGLSLAGWSSDQMWMFAGSSYNPNVNQSTNFGGYTEMSISSAANDENGYGTFEYAPPTGFLAMCSKNLAEYGG